MSRDSTQNLEATIVSALTIQNEAKNLSFEGINFLSINQGESSTSDIHFEKCKISNFEGGSSGAHMNWSFINCVLIRIYISQSPSDMHYDNCIIMQCELENENAIQNFQNCFVRISHIRNYRSGLPGGMGYGSFKNSVICNDQGWGEFPNTVSASNNIGINNVIFTNVPNANSNVRLEGTAGYDVFKTYRGSDAYSENETFELTDDAKATYLGDDGTQVGIYGGEYPFNTTLSYPQFTKATVAKKAVDGKLSVNIELNGGN